MTEKRIKQLLEVLPEPNEYAGEVQIAKLPLNKRGMHRANISVQATNDPAFGWKFVHAHLMADKELHSSVKEPEIRRAFAFCKNDTDDEDALTAMGLRMRICMPRRIMLEAMLLLPQYTYQDIAREVCLTEMTIKIYAELYWNVRDRLHDKLYIANILYPETTQVTWRQGYLLEESPVMLGLRAAHHHGLDPVKRFLGVLPPAPVTDIAAEIKKLEASILAEASHMVDLGFVHLSADGQNQPRRVESKPASLRE